MKLSMILLDKIRETELPVPGSINFTNAQETIEVPIYKTAGWLSSGVEGDPSGMESTGEVIRELVAVLIFGKNEKAQCWDLEHYTRADIQHTVKVAVDFAEKQIQEHTKEVQLLLKGNTEVLKQLRKKK